MQQAALVPAAVFDRANDGQACRAVAVDFAVHAERFCEVGHFQGWRDTTDAIGTGTQDVAGPGFHPVGTAVVFTAQAFWPDDRNGEVFRQPGIRGHALLFHRLFKPREVEFFQLFADVERFGAAVPVVAVDHQVDVRADRFTHRGTGFDIHFWIGGKGDGRHPGVQLDRFVTAGHQFFGKAGVLFRRGETARQIIATHGAAISRNFIAVAAEQLPHRHVEFTANQIPQRLLNKPQRTFGQLVGAAALPVCQLLPDLLAIKRVLADHHFTKEGIDHKRAHHFRRCK